MLIIILLFHFKTILTFSFLLTCSYSYCGSCSKDELVVIRPTVLGLSTQTPVPQGLALPLYAMSPWVTILTSCFVFHFLHSFLICESADDNIYPRGLLEG